MNSDREQLSRRQFLRVAALSAGAAALAASGVDGLLPDASAQEVEPNEVTFIKGVDLMKLTKDTQWEGTQISIDDKNTVMQLAVELGATHVAIVTPYDNTPSTDTVADTHEWVAAARENNLHVSHRHVFMTLESQENNGEEGLYETQRDFSKDYIELMRQWMIDNQDLIQDGDTWTPMPEPQNVGIKYTNCNPEEQMCYFDSMEDFKEFIQKSIEVSRNTLEELGKNVEVICCGFDGFITSGNNNPDWQDAPSLLDPPTIASLRTIAVDHYPQIDNTDDPDLPDRRRTYKEDLAQITSKHPGVQFYLTEVGYPDIEDAEPIDSMFAAFKEQTEKGNLLGVFWWPFNASDLGEGLLNPDFSPNENFHKVQAGFASLPTTVTKRG